MASIEKRIRENGSFGYKVRINKNGQEINRTFSDEKDANLFIYYREKLIENMKNFDVPLNERLTIEQIFELKIEKTKGLDSKSISDMRISMSRITNILGENKFYHDISSEEWTDVAKNLMTLTVYRGAKNKNCERCISLKSLKKIFAHISSCVTFCQNMGFKLENKPLIVIQNTITPMINEERNRK